jgi:hypothetical protein
MAVNWDRLAEALAIIGATSKDMGASIGGRQGGHIEALQALRERKRLEEAQQKYGTELQSAMTPQTFYSPSGPGNPAPVSGAVQPDEMRIAALLARAPKGYDASPALAAWQIGQRARESEQDLAERRRQYDVASVDEATRGVEDALTRSLTLGERRNEAVTQRNFEREMAEYGRETGQQLQDARMRADLANAPSRSQQGEGIWRLANGRTVAPEFIPGRGLGFRDEQNNWQPMPSDAKRTSVGAGGYLNAQQFMKLRNDFTQEQQALQRLNRYFQSVGNMDVGIARVADQVAANVRTAFGSKTLTPEQLATQMANGQLQGLLGLFRVDVVGPGVMTEYDAQRVIAALGGNVDSLQNPQVVAALLRDLYGDKMERVRLMQSEIERSREVFGTGAMPITAPAILGGGQPPSPQGGGRIPYANAAGGWKIERVGN